MPITPSSQYRDTVPWVKEMLPDFKQSCYSDNSEKNHSHALFSLSCSNFWCKLHPTVCMSQGWSVLVLCSQATVGEWEEAWHGIQKLPEAVFSTAGSNSHYACFFISFNACAIGGDGHSRSNSLWWIATRPNILPSSQSK